MDAARFSEHALTAACSFFSSMLPEELVLGGPAFEQLWELHPAEQPTVRFGDELRTAPRWHQAFGRSYTFSGFDARPAPLPAVLEPTLAWARSVIDSRLNGLLVNWYDGARAHRIAPHRDAPEGLVPDCPIVTVSFGAPRLFQMIVRKRRHDLELVDGSVVVIPAETNLRFAHAVPHRDGDTGRRVSVTMRGYR